MRGTRLFSIILINLYPMEQLISKVEDCLQEFQPLAIKTTSKQINSEIQSHNFYGINPENVVKADFPSPSLCQTCPIDPSLKETSETSKIVIPKSINHNFQKHAVVTIKKLTINIGASFGNSSTDILAHQMWNVFLTSGIKSKKILVILFGAAKLQNQQYKELLKQCYFGQLCSYGQQAIRSAQDYLREKVSKLLDQERVRKNIVECRNMKNREAFFYYFMDFVEKIKTGPLLKFRISAATSHRIASSMNKFPSCPSKPAPKRVRIKRKRLQ